MKILILVLTILTINMPHPIFSIKQRQVYHSEFKDFSLLWGKTGSGKSFVANLKFYKWICRAPKNSKFILSGNTQESLHDNVISELKKFDAGINWLQYKTVANKQRLIVKHTGTRVKCIGANNEKAQDRIQGGNEDGWYADEVIKQPKSFVDMAISRCRYEKNGVLTFAPVLWTFNPDGQSHYIKTDYFDKIQEINGEEIFFSFEDNPLIYDEIKKGFKGDFVDKIKKRFTGVFKLRMVEGKWANAEGVIYDKFDRNKHIVESYPIPEVKEYVLGIDWGYAKDHPLAIGLFAVTDRAYYCIDEIYVEQQLIDQSLIEIMKKKGWYKLPITWKPTGQFTKTQSDFTKPSYAYCDNARPDLMKQFKDLSGITTIGAVKDVEDGIQAVQRKFIQQGDGSYGFYFLKGRVPNHIREFELYRWDSLISGHGKNVPKKVDDHSPDEVRYMVYTRERGRVKMLTGSPFRS